MRKGKKNIIAQCLKKGLCSLILCLTIGIILSTTLSTSAALRIYTAEDEESASISVAMPEPVEVGKVHLPAAFSDTTDNILVGDTLLATVFDTLIYSERPLRILHIGDSHIKAGNLPAAVFETLQGLSDTPLRSLQKDEVLCQKAIPLAQAKRFKAAAVGAFSATTADSMLTYSVIGINGASAVTYTQDAFGKLFAEQQPDLIILSLGTNDCHGWGYNEESHRRNVKKLLAIINTYCPETTVLLTTPPGDYLRKYLGRKKGYSYQKNPMVARCATLLSNFSEENNMPVWNLNAIAGGEKAITNWASSGLLSKDKVHYTPEGYSLQGHLLGEAILKAYNRHLELL